MLAFDTLAPKKDIFSKSIKTSNTSAFTAYLSGKVINCSKPFWLYAKSEIGGRKASSDTKGLNSVRH